MKNGIVEKAVGILARDGIAPTLDGGKICFQTNNVPGGPWLYIKYSNHNCTMLRTFLFECVSKRLPPAQKFIPSECMNCYKVVARPETFKDLIRLKRIMKKMGMASKCGIEKRNSVDALYGGYWYCNSFDEGLERLEQVREALTGTGIPFFLKRSCTEYEQIFGPSDLWETTDDQLEIEKEVFSRVAIDNTKQPQGIEDRKRIYKLWKEWAKAVGPDYPATYNYITYGGGNGYESRHEGSQEEV